MTEKQSTTLCAGGVMSFGALGLALCLGCAGPGNSPSTTDVTVEFVRERHGGLCPGPDGGGATCRSRIVVRDDGTWSLSGTESTTPVAGAVRLGAASDLASIVDEEWETLTARAFTGTCPTAYDGSEVVYTVRRIPRGAAATLADADVRELPSCTYDLSHPDAQAVLVRLGDLWRTLALPD